MWVKIVADYKRRMWSDDEVLEMLMQAGNDLINIIDFAAHNGAKARYPIVFGKDYGSAIIDFIVRAECLYLIEGVDVLQIW